MHAKPTAARQNHTSERPVRSGSDSSHEIGSPVIEKIEEAPADSFCLPAGESGEISRALSMKSGPSELRGAGKVTSADSDSRWCSLAGSSTSSDDSASALKLNSGLFSESGLAASVAGHLRSRSASIGFRG